MRAAAGGAGCISTEQAGPGFRTSFRGSRADPEAVQRELPATENPRKSRRLRKPSTSHSRKQPDRTERGQRVPPPGRESGASAHAAVSQWRMVESAFPILHARGKQLLRPRTGDRGQAPVSVFSSPQMPLLPPCLNPLICFYKRTYLQESALPDPVFPVAFLKAAPSLRPGRHGRRALRTRVRCACGMGAVPGRGNRAENRTRTGILFPARRSCRVALPARRTRTSKGEQGQTNGERATGRPGRPGAGNTANPACPRSFTQAQGIGPSPPGSMPNPALPALPDLAC